MHRTIENRGDDLIMVRCNEVPHKKASINELEEKAHEARRLLLKHLKWQVVDTTEDVCQR